MLIFLGEIPLPRLSGKSDVFVSPQKYHTNSHILRDFPENYESFRNGVSPERRSSTSSENDSILSDKPVRNLSKSFENNSIILQHNNSKNSHDKSTNINSKRNSSSVHPPQSHQQRLKSSTNKGSSVQNPALTSEGKQEGEVRGKDGKLWPAWVYCTRYSDRPSSGKRM